MGRKVRAIGTGPAKAERPVRAFFPRRARVIRSRQRERRSTTANRQIGLRLHLVTRGTIDRVAEETSFVVRRGLVGFAEFFRFERPGFRAASATRQDDRTNRERTRQVKFRFFELFVC